MTLSSRLREMSAYSGIHFIMSNLHKKQTITELEEQYSDVESQLTVREVLDINETYNIVKNEVELEGYKEEKNFLEEEDVIINEL